MQHVVITGAKGFLGRYLARHLQAKGFFVSGLGHGAWHESETAHWGVANWLKGDVSASNLDKLASDFGSPKYIFHLAGGSMVASSLLTPSEDFQSTVVSCSIALEWIRLRASACRLVFASSAAVYGSGHIAPIREGDVTSPYSPYGYHKRVGELMCESYSRNFGLYTSSVRLFSVYGPELRKQLSWDFCNRLLLNPEVLTVSGTGEERRDWIHVRDAVSFLERAAELASSDGFTVNAGTGIATTVKEFISEIAQCWGISPKIQFNDERRRGDPEFLAADESLAREKGMEAIIDWREGLKEYVAWFKATNTGVME